MLPPSTVKAHASNPSRMLYFSRPVVLENAQDLLQLLPQRSPSPSWRNYDVNYPVWAFPCDAERPFEEELEDETMDASEISLLSGTDFHSHPKVPSQSRNRNQVSARDILHNTYRLWRILHNLEQDTKGCHKLPPVTLDRLQKILSISVNNLLGQGYPWFAIKVDSSFFGCPNSESTPFPALGLQRDIYNWKSHFRVLFGARSGKYRQRRKSWPLALQTSKLPLPFEEFEFAIRKLASTRLRLQNDILWSLRFHVITALYDLQGYHQSPLSKSEQGLAGQEMELYQYVLSGLNWHDKTQPWIPQHPLHKLLIDLRHCLFERQERIHNSLGLESFKDTEWSLFKSLNIFSTMLTTESSPGQMKGNCFQAFWLILQAAERVMNRHSTEYTWDEKMHNLATKVILDAFSLLIQQHDSLKNESLLSHLRVEDTWWLRILERFFGTYSGGITYRLKDNISWNGPIGLQRLLKILLTYHSINDNGSVLMSVFPPPLVQDHILKCIFYEHSMDELTPVSLPNVGLRLDLFLGAVASTRPRTGTYHAICDMAAETLQKRTKAVAWLSGREMMAHVAVESIIAMWRQKIVCEWSNFLS